VPDASIAANLNETFNIKADHLPELTLNLVLTVNELSNAINFLIRESIYFGSRIDASLS